MSPHINCGDPNFRLQSTEERAEIRRKRRQYENDQRRARGEPPRTFEGSVAEFIIAMGSAVEALRALRAELQRRERLP